METQTEMLTTEMVAKRLVSLCREGKNVEAIEELYSDDLISIEPSGSLAELTKGKDAVMAKTHQWYSTIEQIHSAYISVPIVTGNHFSCAMDMDLTLKGMGRNMMNEICVYEVRDGKIVFEQFFYNIKS